MGNRQPITLEKIIVYSIKGLVLVLPLFFLPWTQEFFEFNKQLFLWLIVPLIIFFWFIAAGYKKGEVKFKRTILDIPVLTFLGLALVSAVFSQDKFSSFFGFYGRASDAWLGILSFVLLYFLIVNFSSNNKKFLLNPTALLKLTVFSYSLVLIFFYLTLFGIFSWSSGSLNTLALSALNLAGGAMEILAGASAIMMVIIFSFDHSYGQSGGLWTWYYKIILVLAFGALIIINFFFAWTMFALAGSILLVFELRSGGFGVLKKNGKVIGLLILIVISLVFMVSFWPGRDINSNRDWLNQELPKEARLGYAEAAAITGQSLKENIFFGTGPGTFIYNFSLYRNDKFNSSQFWQLRFDKAPSQLLEIVSTQGALGFLSYLLVIGLALFICFSYFKYYYLNRKKDATLAFFISLVALTIWQIFYLTNTYVLFLFWLILALAMVTWQDSKKLFLGDIKINFGQANYARIFTVVIFLAASGWLVLAGYEIKYFIADIYARTGSESNLIKASVLNPYRYNYKIKLAKIYLNKLKAEILKTASQRDAAAITNNINSSLTWAKAAVRTTPDLVMTQESLAMVYRDINLVAGGSELLAIEAFEKAVSLEPTNPVLVTELGKAYLGANLLEKAEAVLKRAINLKEDYHDAKFTLAKVYARSNKIDEAIASLDELALIYQDEEIYYEIGRLYYNQGDIQAAVDNFSEAIKINPSHSNSIYSIGLTLELVGRKEEALKYFKKVLELNPGNEEVTEKIKVLSS